ncbi:aldo/keto reductase [Burkholderia plantarii]|uniref:aldo/keto reductase n=1 Tax=Burkholderia plantarii TaxID=41899 RepID=UPI000A8C8142|nr:aldo/keto reductase [Burkholderia plantarii]
MTMRQRRFGRLGWQVGEVGYGMWGIAGGEGGWTGADDASGMQCLALAASRGCNFYDTAWIYGRGHSERMVAKHVAAHPGAGFKVATKIAPANRNWPSRRGDRFDDIYPTPYLREAMDQSRRNLNVDRIDLMQFHVWEDSWTDDPAFRAIVDEWRGRDLVEGIGLSLNRWEPWNGLRAVRSGLIDAVQVIHNIFDQAPEDELFPACREHDVAVIARVPFDEGSLTGTLTYDSRWPDGDWRNSYFVPENLRASVDRADALRPLIPAGETMAGLALRFILSHPDVAVVIPGMRQERHVSANLAASAAGPLPPELVINLRAHRWDREPTEWSQ